MNARSEAGNNSVDSLESLQQELAQCQRELDEFKKRAGQLVTENEALRENFRDRIKETTVLSVHEGMSPHRIRANHAALQILGIAPAESSGIYGKTFVGDWHLDFVDDAFVLDETRGIEKFIRYVHPGDRTQVERSFLDAVTALQDWDSEFRVNWPDGSEHWISARGSIYRTVEGKATRIFGIVMDITERKRTEIENARLFAYVQECEAKVRLAIHTIPVLAWLCDPIGQALFLNQQWCDYTGLSLQEALGLNWKIALHPDDLGGLEAHIAKLIVAPAKWEYEARMRRADGAYRWFLFRCTPLLDDSGAVLRWYGCNIDIEERKRIEHALLASEQLSRGQVETLAQILNAMANESVPDRLEEHILRTINLQFKANSISVWRRDKSSGMICFEAAFEDDRLVSKLDARFAGTPLQLPMEGFWPWPEVFQKGKASVIEDIREVKPFALRDRLIPMGIITVLLVPMTVAGQLEGAIGIRFKERRVIREDELGLAGTLANQVMLAMQLTRLSSESRDSAVLAERNRMAREIHDTLAQGFIGVIVQLQAAEDAKMRGLPDDSDEHLCRAADLARESLNEARRSVRALRPKVLENNDWCAALEAMMLKSAIGTGLRTEFNLRGEPRPLPPNWEENLLRIGQEIFTNVLRHASARHFIANIVFDPDAIRLELKDDGRGFDPGRRGDGFGLIGVHERVTQLGGELLIESAPGKGAAVIIAVPLSDPSRTLSS